MFISILHKRGLEVDSPGQSWWHHKVKNEGPNILLVFSLLSLGVTFVFIAQDSC